MIESHRDYPGVYSGFIFRSSDRDVDKASLHPVTSIVEESTMTISIFIGTSLDGFIARPNDDQIGRAHV